MPTNSKKKSPKETSGNFSKASTVFGGFIKRQRKKIVEYKTKRPHRSLRLTRRRDYVRPLELPGYIHFTHIVNKIFWSNRRLFVPLIIIYAVLYAVLVGVASQETYSSVSQSLGQVSDSLFDGDWGALGQAGVTLLSLGAVGTTTASTEIQQIFSVLILLLVWLTTVWLLRNILAGHRVKLRDGIYSSGSPIFASAIIVMVIAVQLLPVAIAAIGYAAAESTGMLAGGGVVAMLFWLAAALLAVLSLYWATSSLFALVIVTLPGMYPLKALQNAGDIVFGRRLKLLLRWLWMVLMTLVAWAVILLPVILIDAWIKSAWPAIEDFPIVPLAILAVSSATSVWVSVYIYMLYRKVVENAPEAK